jgi:nitronate monooxygenase
MANSVVQRLGIAQPIVQGPFGGGLSTTSLAATVSELGGLGSFGAHHLAPDEIGRVCAELRGLTSRPFAVNLWVSDHDDGGLALDAREFERVTRLFEPWYRDLGIEPPAMPARYGERYDEQVDALLEARPPVFSFVFGVPSRAVLAECRRRDIATIGAATSVAEARMLEAAGVDVIVATGFEAGGHRPSFLARAEDALMGTFALTQLVTARVRTPLIAAGGIADRRGVRAAFALGAEGVQVGTAFLACEESGATPEHREALFGEEAYATTLTRAFTGRLARGIRNRWTEEMGTRTAELPPFPIQSWFAGKMRASARAARRADVVALWSGQIAPNLRHRTAAAVWDELTNGVAGVGDTRDDFLTLGAAMDAARRSTEGGST